MSLVYHCGPTDDQAKAHNHARALSEVLKTFAGVYLIGTTFFIIVGDSYKLIERHALQPWKEDPKGKRKELVVHECVVYHRGRQLNQQEYV